MNKSLAMAMGILFWAGCIDFEKQTMTYRHFPKADTLVIWQQYEGIFGESEKNGLSETELEQLHSVRTTQRTFFFGNWIAEYGETETAEAIEDMQNALKQANPELDPAVLRQGIALGRLLQKSVKIKNGPFYLNAQGKLSATQEVTLTNVRQIIQLANHLMRESISQEIARGDLAKDDDKYRHLLEKSVEQGMEYISLDGQRLRFRWPMTAAMFKDALMDDDLADAIAQFQKAGGTVQHANDLLTVELGKVDGGVTALTLNLPQKKIRANAVKPVDAKYGINRQYKPEQARADFFKRMTARYKK